MSREIPNLKITTPPQMIIRDHAGWKQAAKDCDLRTRAAMTSEPNLQGFHPLLAVHQVEMGSLR
jgi:hypothetical protein